MLMFDVGAFNPITGEAYAYNNNQTDDAKDQAKGSQALRHRSLFFFYYHSLVTVWFRSTKQNF